MNGELCRPYGAHRKCISYFFFFASWRIKVRYHSDREYNPSLTYTSQPTRVLYSRPKWYSTGHLEHYKKQGCYGWIDRFIVRERMRITQLREVMALRNPRWTPPKGYSTIPLRLHTIFGSDYYGIFPPLISSIHNSFRT